MRSPSSAQSVARLPSRVCCSLALPCPLCSRFSEATSQAPWRLLRRYPLPFHLPPIPFDKLDIALRRSGRRNAPLQTHSRVHLCSPRSFPHRLGRLVNVRGFGQHSLFSPLVSFGISPASYRSFFATQPNPSIGYVRSTSARARGAAQLQFSLRLVRSSASPNQESARFRTGASAYIASPCSILTPSKLLFALFRACRRRVSIARSNSSAPILFQRDNRPARPNDNLTHNAEKIAVDSSCTRTCPLRSIFWPVVGAGT